MCDQVSIPLPTAGQLKSAIKIYLALAYPDGRLPPAVEQRRSPVLATPDSNLIEPSWFETSVSEGQTLYRLRLGQKDYPHMKISLMPSPDSSGYLFFADAHDSHLHAPAGSPDDAFLIALRKSNSALASEIEKAWAANGLPTFRGYLKDSLRSQVGEKT